MATSTAPALVLSLGAVLGTAPAIAEDPPFGTEPPLTAVALAECSGRYTISSDAVDLSATVTDNTVRYLGTGGVPVTNTIDSSAFTDAAGVFTVIQNAGNNVVIQTGVAITVELVQ